MANLQGKSVPLLALHGEEPVRVYGGVRNDFKWVERGHGIGFVGYFAIVDPVLSFIGDTVTLPHVLKKIREKRLDKAAQLKKFQNGDLQGHIDN